MTNDMLEMNRKTAIRVVRERLGLITKSPTDWTYEERTAYNKALAQYIADYPNAFTPEQVQTAKDIKSRTISPLDDTSLAASLGAFGDAFLEEAERVTEVGGNVLRNSIYLAVGLAVAIYLFPYALRKID